MSELPRDLYYRQLRLVAARELAPALAGGDEWRQFVAWAERTLGEPWETIRRDIDALHRREAVRYE